MVNDLPVHQVPGVQDGKSGNTIKAGGNHVEIFLNPDDIRIGIICMNDGIPVIAISQVGLPGLRNYRFGGQDYITEKQQVTNIHND
jgi:hypothetical protein